MHDVAKPYVIRMWANDHGISESVSVLDICPNDKVQQWIVAFTVDKAQRYANTMKYMVASSLNKALNNEDHHDQNLPLWPTLYLRFAYVSSFVC